MTGFAVHWNGPRKGYNIFSSQGAAEEKTREMMASGCAVQVNGFPPPDGAQEFEDAPRWPVEVRIEKGGQLVGCETYLAPDLDAALKMGETWVKAIGLNQGSEVILRARWADVHPAPVGVRAEGDEA